MKKLAPHVATLTHLTFLEARTNELSDDGAGVLSQLLLKLPRLKYLEFPSESFSKHIVPQVSALSALEHLDLSDWSIKDVMRDGFSHHLSHLTCLNLTRLNLKRCEVKDSHMKVLAPSLGNLPELRFLEVGGNNCSSVGVDALLQHMSHVSAMQSLDLRAIRMTEPTLAALVKHLQTLSLLKAVMFDVNAYVGISAAAEEITAVRSLTDLTQSIKHVSPLCGGTCRTY